ncbi:cytochrome-c oxidase, cbb3-type subunit III [Pollutimonas sp. M17]|uniref:cytochrome-c oxidase, cbb3-type subunit III n=1 Tax=Pollutimonas sp. M17 TaxID=2962065 RepID=UPI0021F46FCF|nr:cytochrome-c oxidase, cbb3-type subunit III [Pollutimonas sp. M17]UYO92402.1 cytochrome-c oxidase, cbb3-type subunit III [Pollutimonas sp. M17]HWK69904.1 cytochrome-c oxidase, cbb3-type subunit III [Burkholderiaceae bacterium]
MSDFVSSFWSYFIAIIAIGGIVFCLWLLFTQRAWLKKTVPQVEDTGHVWDGDLTELNTPVPRWWTVFYIGLCVIALGMLFLYPGLGSYEGTLGYTAARQVKAQQEAMNEQIRPVYARYKEMPITEVAHDEQAREIGQRLFLNNCAQCHGSDARGSGNFPNLADGDWLYGGAPEQILQTITKGRHGMMPAWKSSIKPAEAADIAQYVRSLSGLASDPLRVVPGKRGFETFCVACHGVEGKGNTALGAPNLTDNVWLYGSSEASIVDTILNGRENRMPAQEGILTEDQIRMLTAWVWGLSNQGTSTAAK